MTFGDPPPPPPRGDPPDPLPFPRTLPSSSPQGFRLAVAAPSGDMPGHLELAAVLGMLGFELTLLPEAAGFQSDGRVGAVT